MSWTRTKSHHDYGRDCRSHAGGASRTTGIGGDSVEKAPLEELNSIIDVVGSVSENDLYGWLAGLEAKRLPPTHEYVAVTCLTMAVDQARLRSDRRQQL
jgi:hypothetical protein